MSIAYGWQPSEWLEWYISEVEFALEQAEHVVGDKNYDDWARAAYIAIAASSSKKKVADLIGEHPQKKRQREAKKQVTLDYDALRKIALDKGLNPNF